MLAIVENSERAANSAILSFGEAVVLADVREREDTVRKDIETGILPRLHIIRRFNDSRLNFSWSYVFTLAAVYGNESLTKELRRTALEKVYHATSAGNPLFNPTNFVSPPAEHDMFGGDLSLWIGVRSCTRESHVNTLIVDIDKFLTIDLWKVCSSVRPRIGIYAHGLGRVESKKGIMGGDVVFKGTRLPVLHIGAMLENGETINSLREDYPYLSEMDLRFAHLYFRAHPPIGRPRLGGGADRVSNDAG